VTTTNKIKQANRFKTIRAQHELEAAEDYTELILELSETKGEARIGEIASHLGISHVTAIRTVKRLQDEGFVVTSPHKPVALTPKGKRIAAAAKERHQLLVRFFSRLGVPKEIAELDAEGCEHHISKFTLKKIAEFLK